MKPTIHAAMLLTAVTLAGTPLHAEGLRIQGFADFTASASSRAGGSSTFGLGQYDLFFTSPLTDRISFLGETVIEYDDGFIVDLERMEITFAPESYFRVAVGKHHTAIGYWNTAYHHGALFQPTSFRPQMFRFEDEGGVLPIHTTGVQVSGRDITRFHLSYDIAIGNGIGSTPTADADRAKSFTFALHSQLTSALRAGASAYLDRIAAGTPTMGGTPVAAELSETLAGGYVAYMGPSLEFLGEYQRSTHRVRDTGERSATDAYYVYGGRRSGRVVAFVRYDELRYPEADPYYVPDDFQQVLVGLRYDLAPTVVTRIEIARPRTASAGVETNVTAQVAVGF